MSETLTAFINRQMDEAASGFARVAGHLTHPRHLRLVEEDGGSFRQLGENGQIFSPLTPRPVLEDAVRDHDIHIELSDRHFLVRPLSLPAGAKPYLDGIIRSQIDRLMPWKADDTLFGWSIVHDTDHELSICVAATQRTKLEALLSPFKGLSAKQFLCQVTVPLEGKPRTITLPFSPTQASAPISSTLLRRVLAGALILSLLCYAAALATQYVIGADLEDLQARLTDLKNQAIETNKTNAPASDPIGAAAERKRAERPLVEVLNDLARLLPDHTYLTATTVENRNIHIEGVSADVTSLPALLDGSGIFANATFTAATTRQRAGDSFRIDATITPRGTSTP